ncbi:ATP-grasp domain-containing protein [Streptomyces katrae]|uniref:ATP-grasp domain-containing protein n=1 Tax=Streptomyces katrae TaxID=68223 RepID=A0ABT7H044_9ACTN|nr:ATP-grasp domain-containing protein [Streptomyces katrae]MDK9499257.1 ATP-grasp domain-containing protein [Streptomyces katrae]
MTAPEPARPDRHDLGVLYLGWQREAVEALQSLGARVTCVVPVSERFKPAEEGFTGTVLAAGDHTSVEHVLGALADRNLAPSSFRVVCTEDEFAIVASAVLAELGRTQPFLTPAVALALRDKGVQKRRVREAGIPVADATRFPGLDALAEAVRSGAVELPVVVKPPAGAGSVHTRLVRDAAELAAFTRAVGDAAGPWLVESFVRGEELHVDGAVRDGRTVVLSVSRYLHNVVEVHEGRLVGSATLDTGSERALSDAVAALTERALRAIGHTDGVFHLEAFHDDGDLVFGECAGRIGGGMILEAVRAKYGVDLYREWAAAALGLPSPAAEHGGAPDGGPEKDSFGWVNLAAPPGRIRVLPSRTAIESRPGVVQGQLWAKEGDRIGDMREGSHLLVAKALVRAPAEATVRERLFEVGRWFGAALAMEPAAPAAADGEDGAGDGDREGRGADV